MTLLRYLALDGVVLRDASAHLVGLYFTRRGEPGDDTDGDHGEPEQQQLHGTKDTR